MHNLLFLTPLLLFAYAAAPVAAQNLPPLTPDQEAALYGLPVLATVGGTILLLNLTKERAEWVLLGMPLVSAASVCGAGRLSGAAGSCRNAFIGGGLGALTGLVLIGGSFLVGDATFGLSGSSDVLDQLAFVLFISGAFAYILAPPALALIGYRYGEHVQVAPALFGAPDAQGLTPGLSLHARF